MNTLDESYIFNYKEKLDNGHVVSIKTIQDRYFHIPKDIFTLLEKHSSNTGEISNMLKAEYIYDLHKKGVIYKASEIEHISESTGEEVEGFVLLKERPLSFALKFFSLFSYARLLIPYLVLILSISFYLYDTNNILTAIPSASVGMGYDILIMLMLYIFTSGIIHELGHSSLLYKYHGKEAPIGVTFNYCFPAFFSDVRDAALLIDKNKKLKVLFAGVLYQIIFFPLLVLPFYFWLGEVALVLLFYMLAIQIFFNLVPFVKNDGYWIYKEMFSAREREKRIHYFTFRLFLVLGIGYISYVVLLTGWHFYSNVVIEGIAVLDQPAFDIFRQLLVSMYIVVGLYKYLSQRESEGEM